MIVTYAGVSHELEKTDRFSLEQLESEMIDSAFHVSLFLPQSAYRTEQLLSLGNGVRAIQIEIESR